MILFNQEAQALMEQLEQHLTTSGLIRIRPTMGILLGV
jgi:hypothetical protein